MKVLIIEAVISCVYVFDASASPLLHIPLTFLTLLYIASILEILGLSRFFRYLKNRFRRAPVSEVNYDGGLSVYGLLLQAVHRFSPLPHP
jgi:hypothetical protein